MPGVLANLRALLLDTIRSPREALLARCTTSG